MNYVGAIIRTKHWLLMVIVGFGSMVNIMSIK